MAGGATRAGDVIFSASSNVNSGGANANLVIDASADNGALAGNVTLGNVGATNRLNVFSVTGDTVTFGDSPSSRAPQGAVVQQVRALLDELSVAGLAKENIRRQLLQGIILETGLSRPGIDEFVGEGVTPPTACQPDQKYLVPNTLAC